MQISALADRTGLTPACATNPMVFAHPALDYDAADETYSHLDIVGHQIAAEVKALAEQDAVNVCYGCPLMMACEEMDIEKQASGVHVAGVIGGRTEAERKARLSPTSTAAVIAHTEAPLMVSTTDRGTRSRVNHLAIANLTQQGKTVAEIAEIVSCSPRTVSRVRVRLAAATKARPGTHQASQSAGVASIVDASRPAPFSVGRQVSAPMAAVYDHLVRVGGAASLDDLLSVGMALIDDAEAMEWWTKRNTTMTNGVRVVRPSKESVSLRGRIFEGARLKMHNALSAAHRKGSHYLHRDESGVFTLSPEAMEAWSKRVAALAA